MKKILLTLALLGVSISGAAAAQGFAPAGSPKGANEQTIYSQGLYSWALRNDKYLEANLDVVMNARTVVARVLPDRDVSDIEISCAVAAPFAKNVFASYNLLLNTFQSSYGAKFPQFVDDLRNEFNAMWSWTSSCAQGSASGDVSKASFYGQMIKLKLFAK